MPVTIAPGSTQWFNGRVSQSCSHQYYCDGSVESGLEGGVDIVLPHGTPITSVSSGKVVGAGWHDPGNYVVTVRGHVPFFKKTLDLYYQHLLDKTVDVGHTVHIGDLLGHSGAAANIEFGINAGAWPGGQNGGQGWGGVWGPLPHPGGRSINPVKSGFLDSIKSNTFLQPGKQSPGTGDVAGFIKDNVHIAPDESLAGLLVGIDTALALTNPFDLPGHGQTEPTTDIGAGITIPDPLTWIGDVAENMVQDAAALIIRSVFALLALAMLYFVIQRSVLAGAEQVLEPVGGVSGLVSKIGAL